MILNNATYATYAQQTEATRAQVHNRVPPPPLSQPAGGCIPCGNPANWESTCRCTLPCGAAHCPAADLDHLYSYLAVPVPVFDPAIRVQPRVWASRYSDPSAPTGAVRAPVDGLAFNESTGRYSSRL